MVLYGLSAAINASTAGYSTSYTTSYTPNGYITSINQTYNPNAARQANLIANKEIQSLEEKMNNDRVIREQGYLKLNTIHPGDMIVGYMNIKHKKGKKLNVIINIGENEFSYLWDIDKKKKNKKQNEVI